MQEETHVIELGKLGFLPGQRRAYREAKLWEEWAERYPDLFDEHDVELACNQAHLGYHYFEWLGAIVVKAITGYGSLVGKYEFSKHERKHEVLRRFVSDPVYSLIMDRERFGRVQCPDLFVFDLEGPEWFFCEVKGPGDRLRPVQRNYFAALAEASGRPVRLLRFCEITT